LSIVGNELRITIPEQWLSEAAYPVVVDPTVGTTTVGSQNRWVMEPGEPPEPLMFELSIPVNRFLVPEAIQSNCLCTAYAYVNEDDREAGGRPVIYSDNGNTPQTRFSANEGFIDLRVVSGKPVGWRSAAFRSNTSINSGSHIWFGVFCEYFWFPRFDWGARCYADWHNNSIPNAYPTTRWTEIYDFKLSMYFTYTNAQNYARTLTQGVNISDSRKLSADYKRNAIQAVQASATPKGIRLFFLTLKEAVHSIDKLFFPVIYSRSTIEKTTVTENINTARLFFRFLFDKANVESEEKNGWIISRKLNDIVHAASAASRGLILHVRIVTGGFIRDYLLGRFLKARSELELKSIITREITLESKV
jgi:hypothetical protein